MLRAALAGFLDALPNERAFDEPFKALLRQRGYYDIHLLHGPFEFGKDFIAKKDDETGRIEQWVLQTKAGNVSKSDWQGIRAQLEEIRTNALGHPNLDGTKPRKPVLAFTGRLIGQAAVSSQEYNTWLKQNKQPEVEFWGIDRLLDLYEDPASALVAAAADGALLGLIGHIDAGDCDDRRIEDFSRRWMSADPQRVFTAGALEASVVAARLSDHNRLDLACYTALAYLRGIWWTALSSDLAGSDLEPIARDARSIFELHAEALWERCAEAHLDPHYLVNVHNEIGGFITYPVRCSRIVELLGLLALLKRTSGDVEQDEAISDYLARFIETQPGARHPISDHWAVALIPSVIAVAARHPDTAAMQLRDSAKWLGDRLEDGPGLAAAWASPREELERVVGGALEHIEYDEVPGSNLATVLLDLAAILELAEPYDDIRCEMNAVEAHPMFLHTLDTPGQADLRAKDARRELGIKYRSDLTHPVASHHVAPPVHRAVRDGAPWDQLAIQSVLRDRHFIAAMRAVADHM